MRNISVAIILLFLTAHVQLFAQEKLENTIGHHLFEKGIELFDNENYSGASEIFAKASPYDSLYPSIQYRHVLAHLEAEKSEKALEICDKMLAEHPSEYDF